jgi:cytochrome c5
MKIRYMVSAAFLTLAMLLASTAGAGTSSSKDLPAPATAPAAPAGNSAQDENMRLEGEKRFRSNCGRCHAAPPKFAPRITATIVRHMRVRANITDEDMRKILRYLAE